MLMVDDPLDKEVTCCDQSQNPKSSKTRFGQRVVVRLAHSPSAPPPVLLWLHRDRSHHNNPALIVMLEIGDGCDTGHPRLHMEPCRRGGGGASGYRGNGRGM